MSTEQVPFGGRFTITKRLEFSASHRLCLPYDSPCNREHGHNYIVEVEVVGHQLNEEGMLIDFSAIKRVVMALDHRNLNHVMGMDNCTAERIALWIAQGVQDVLDTSSVEGAYVDYVSVQENEGNEAVWER